MRPYSVDEHWQLLEIEHHAHGRRPPWLDRAWYGWALRWLRWRIRCACRRPC